MAYSRPAATSEVFVLAAGPQLFARVREGDCQTVITTLSDDRAQLIHGEARQDSKNPPPPEGGGGFV